MNDCNAKITTATVTDEQVGPDLWSAYFDANAIPDGATVQRQGDRLVRVDLHPLECTVGQIHPPAMAHQNPKVDWWDDTPGATPHTNDVCPTCKGARSVSSGWPPHPCSTCDGTGRKPDVTVTDAEVEAAHFAVAGNRLSLTEWRRALLAAKRAAKEQT